ncbi:GPI inositol-deacylase [Dactylosporangium matsuzakiense]|uniref:Serine peptidase n=1 Tax=Dactylosporangium matsuzakiense TaxID=53360 RepID=A0A9W6KZP6_9ACTN|nr:GPI inositol-deacylase [Dactylosporangium matsuzakiense]UWZ48105.1 hypothetical protein Dmats_17895 [Dactylosporangium matsuzakiense]GLL08409.1 hypothetical protein GCM10017581_101700 [Dactylosporangium matsuzakiense]
MHAPIVAVHGVASRQPGLDPPTAALALAERWTARLADGYRAAGRPGPPPRLAAAYYAHLLDVRAQEDPGDLDALSPQERDWARTWLTVLGVPPEAAPGPPTRPLRQALDRLARRRGRPAEALGRVMAALLREVYVYMTRPALRERCRVAVVEALERSGAHIVVAHSLGTVVAYEALCARPDLTIELLVTLGSPLGLPGAVFDGLVPPPAAGRAERPAGVGRWVDLADPGDLVATPARLGDHFPADRHEEVDVGLLDPHTFGGYLSSGPVAAAIDPYV